EQIGADRRVVEDGWRAARHPPLDQRLGVVPDETPSAEVGRGLVQGEDGGARRGMVDPEHGEPRLRSPPLSSPLPPPGIAPLPTPPPGGRGRAPGRATAGVPRRLREQAAPPRPRPVLPRRGAGGAACRTRARSRARADAPSRAPGA